jgi:type II secretory pathway pseudopilin PulG
MKTSPKDFFTWVAAMLALLVSTISLIVLWFEYIDRFWSHGMQYELGYSSSIVTAMSTLVVIFPLFIWFTRMLHVSIRNAPEKKDLWVRKWLVVATVFVSGAVLAIDLITLVSTFLSGEELTTAFLMKVFSVLALMGGVLLYYLHELKGTWDTHEKESKMIGVLVSLIVIGTVASAFLIIGSPRSQRLMRYDQQKINDLQSIQSQIIDHYQRMGTVPESLEVLNDPLSYFVLPIDPQAGAMRNDAVVPTYSYARKSATTFSVCAVFNTETRASTYADPTLEYWQHGVGEVCFDRTIDPLKFPNIAPQTKI